MVGHPRIRCQADFHPLSGFQFAQPLSQPPQLVELPFDFENQILMLPAPNLPWFPSTWIKPRLICRHKRLLEHRRGPWLILGTGWTGECTWPGIQTELLNLCPTVRCHSCLVAAFVLSHQPHRLMAPEQTIHLCSSPLFTQDSCHIALPRLSGAPSPRSHQVQFTPSLLWILFLTTPSHREPFDPLFL